MNTIAHPHPDPPPGHTQNASAFCVGTRPLRASPCRGGGISPADSKQVLTASIAIHRKFQTKRAAEDSTRLYGEAVQHSMRLSVDGYIGTSPQMPSTRGACGADTCSQFLLRACRLHRHTSHAGGRRAVADSENRNGLLRGRLLCGDGIIRRWLGCCHKRCCCHHPGRCCCRRFWLRQRRRPSRPLRRRSRICRRA